MTTNEVQLLEALRDIAEVAQKAVGAAGEESSTGGKVRSRDGRALQTNPIQVDVRGNIFESVSVEHTYDDTDRRPGTLSIVVANGSGEWVAGIFECPYPYTLIWDTGRIENESSASASWPLVYHAGKSINVKRWRPGLFGIPGDGGGEMRVPDLPVYGDVSIRVSVIG